MTLFRDQYRVESTRLQGWDYAAAGWYIITICTQGRAHFFGEVVDGEMVLSAMGEAARRYWGDIPNHFTHVRLAESVVMPNHVHGIVIIGVETRHVVSLQGSGSLANKFGPLKPGSLQATIHAFKAAVTRWCRKNGYDQFSWQSRFHEHIIRNETSLNRIREYIVNNPMKWESDRYNLQSCGPNPEATWRLPPSRPGHPH